MFKSALRIVLTTLVVAANAWPVDAATYLQTNLVSDLSGLAATITDPLLQNAWGISHSPTSPFWVSNQGTNTSTLYGVTGSTNVTKVSPNANGFVAIPTTPSGPQGPTGQVFNTNTSASSFPVGNGGNNATAHFIFADLNGTISAWNTGTTAFTQVTTPGALYTGLAINNAGTMLYAVDNAAGTINVFNSNFAPAMNLPPGAFATPATIAAMNPKLVPFNVQNISGSIFVTYAPVGRAAQTAATPGQGAVAVFSETGALQTVLTGAGHLAAPWGIALAPAAFGQFGGDLLVGNFSYANIGITALDPVTGAFEGTIPINVGPSNPPSGLWALSFGTGTGLGGDPNTLFFTDGINSEKDGLFASISVVPEPATWAMMLLGFAGLGFAFQQSRRKLSIA
jgi:uncharacterized protein (TIGR03118 family)